MGTDPDAVIIIPQALRNKRGEPDGVRSCNDTSRRIKKAVVWRAPYDWNLPVQSII
jgi:hypothetical protein